MAGLDNIPQKQTIELEIAKIEESTFDKIKELSNISNTLVNDFGTIYIRKKELADELANLDSILEKSEAEFKKINVELKEIVDGLDDKYPQGRINMQEGTIQYQPGAPTRKQQLERQQNAEAKPKV